MFTASFIITLNGSFLYFISYIASFKIAKSTVDILSIVQPFFKFFSIIPVISSLFSFIPLAISFTYSLALVSSTSWQSKNSFTWLLLFCLCISWL